MPGWNAPSRCIPVGARSNGWSRTRSISATASASSATAMGTRAGPGAEPPGASLFGALGGLTCFLLPELTRPALFDAMRARHHYGTTGCRLHLETAASWDGAGVIWTDDPRLDGARFGPRPSSAIMGDIVELRSGVATFSVGVEAASPIMSRRNSMCGGEILEVVRPHIDDPSRPPSARRMERSGISGQGAPNHMGRPGDRSRGPDRSSATNQFPQSGPAAAPARARQGHMVVDHYWERGWRRPSSSLTHRHRSGSRRRMPRSSVRCRNWVPFRWWSRAASSIASFVCLGPRKTLGIRSVRIERQIPLRTGDNPLYVCVTLEDGHRAWSSPIYLIRSE